MFKIAAVPPARGSRDRSDGPSRPIAIVSGEFAVAVVRSPEWLGDAACRHEDPDLFFPQGMTGPARSQVEQARQVCRPCPVRTRCLAFALVHSLGFGVWGATTPEERRAIRYAPTRRQA
jgi:WhiB family redox-sensing transcriptional regulator